MTSVDPDSVPAIFELVSAIWIPYLSGAEWQDVMIMVLWGSSSDWAGLEAGSADAGSAFHCSSWVFCCCWNLSLLLRLLRDWLSRRPRERKSVKQISTDHFYLLPWPLVKKHCIICCGADSEVLDWVLRSKRVFLVNCASDGKSCLGRDKSCY